MGKITDLEQRNGIYRCRKRCPPHLWREGLPPDKAISLRTRDKALALERLSAARNQIDDFYRQASEKAANPSGIVATHQRPTRPNDVTLPSLLIEDVKELARGFFIRARDEMEHQTARRCDYTPLEREHVLTELQHQRAGLDDQDQPEHPAHSAEIDVLRRAGRRSAYRSEASTLLRSYLLRALRQLYDIEIARLRGDFRDRIQDSLFQSELPAISSIPQAAASATRLLDIVDRWAAERKPQPKTVRAHRAVAQWFIDRVGDVPVELLTPHHVVAFIRAEAIKCKHCGSDLSEQVTAAPTT